jgi:PASTA domain
MVLVPDTPTDLAPERVAELLDLAKRRGRRQRRLRDAVRAAAFVALLAAVVVPLAVASGGGSGGGSAANHGHSFPLVRVEWNRVRYPCVKYAGSTKTHVDYVRPTGSADLLAVVVEHECTPPAMGAVYVFDGATGPRRPLLLQTLVPPSSNAAPIQASVENPSTGSISVLIETDSNALQPLDRNFNFRHGRYRLAQSSAGFIVVPNVIGESQAQAEATLAEVGLGASVRDTSEPTGSPLVGKVVSQSPAAGSMAAPRGMKAPHSTVSLSVGD